MNNEDLIVLHEEGCVVNSVISEGQSPESTAQKECPTPESPKQESSALKSTEDCTSEMDTAQDRGNSPEPLTENQARRPVSISGIIALEDGSAIITLRIQNHFSGKIKYAEVPYDNLTPETLRKCVTKNGGAPTDWKDLYNVLMYEIAKYKQSNLIEVKYGHTKLGWSKEPDNIAFYGPSMISSDNQSSEYVGKIDIKPKGTLENIVGMIKEWILSTPEWSPLEAIIAFSIASIVLPFAKFAWGKVMDNIIIHLLGNSTTGKSSSLRLHAGLASNPFNEKSGFWLNHQSSLSAMIRRIGDNQGFPVSIDELSSASKKEYSDFVYAVGNGDEKDRLTAGGTAFCNSAKFSTIVLSSGEVSILRKCNKNAGIRARCVEFSNVGWTDSKEQADAIYDCLRDNYGWVAPLVAEELLNNSEKWRARWEQIYNQVKGQMDEEKILLSVGSRMSEFVVLFTLAAEIANEVLHISLNVDEIRDFCYLNIIVVNAEEANLGERAYEYLLRYTCERPDEFPEEERCISQFDTYFSKTGIKGFFRRLRNFRNINGKEYRQQLVFFKDAYEEVLHNRGFEPKTVNKELKDAKLLQTKDKARYTYPVVFNGAKENCYVLYCNDEDEMAFESGEWANGTSGQFGEDDYEG